MGYYLRRHNTVRLLPLVGLLLLAAIAPASVGASELIARNAKNVRLTVSPRGVAHLSYRAHGRTRHVLVWGAINARAPNTARPQVKFRVDYSGGAARGGMPHWRTLRNSCRPYNGPRLRWLVTACKAPDGSYWAVQAWSRIVPRGRTMTDAGVNRELRISHWRGQIAKLEMNVDWAYGRFDHVYGGLTYSGTAVHGFQTTRTGGPLDTYGRNVYLDTLHSGLGPGWRRENGFVTHNPSGAFCYTLYPQPGVPFGKGEAYRATVIGPGVTPDVGWEGRAPGPFDPLLDVQANAEQQELFRNDGRCRPK